MYKWGLGQKLQEFCFDALEMFCKSRNTTSAEAPGEKVSKQQKYRQCRAENSWENINEKKGSYGKTLSSQKVEEMDKCHQKNREVRNQ